MQRSEIKAKYNLEGDDGLDCVKTCFCGCCTLIQENNEVKDREEKANVRGYNTPAPMAYQPADGKANVPSPQAQVQNQTY
jgi:hypothetical protein